MARRLAHLGPRYLSDRLAWTLWQRRNPECPWLVPAAVEMLDDWLRPSDVMVEFGSGRSTRWFARRVAHITSVEHHAEWHALVRKQLDVAGVTNADYRLAPEEPGPYLAAAEEGLAGRGADLILVDGRLRDHCALWALDHLGPRGLLVIDNANWYLTPSHGHSPASHNDTDEPASPLWAEFTARTERLRRVWFTNGVNDTLAIFNGTSD